LTDTTLVFSIVSAIIVLGFLGELVFKKTGVPMFVFMVLMGILIGPVLGLFPRSSIVPSLGVFAELTLLMVLFYGGMGTKLGAVLKGGGRAFLQVALSVIGSTVAIAIAFNMLLGWDLVSSFIYASIVGGETTAVVVIPLSKSLKLPEVTVGFLSLESAMNSIFIIIIFFAFVGVYQTGSSSWGATIGTIAANFSVGIVLGGLLSIGWVFLLHQWQDRKYTYVLTLGLMFATYVISTRLGGSGELSVLVFGIVLGNYSILNGLLNRQFSMDVLQRRLGVFQEEVSFLMQTLFFVFLGLAFEVSTPEIAGNLLIGIEVVLILVLVRTAATSASTARSELSKYRREIILMCAQGLTPATLVIIAVNLGLPHANSALNIVTYVILITNTIAAAGAVARMRSQKSSFKEFMAGLDSAYGQGPATTASA
jgi:cell volume regulation protein A